MIDIFRTAQIRTAKLHYDFFMMGERDDSGLLRQNLVLPVCLDKLTSLPHAALSGQIGARVGVVKLRGDFGAISIFVSRDLQ